MLGRRNKTIETTPPVLPPVPGTKGRPTPKRSEAEKVRRQQAKAPKDRKEAYRQARARQRAERQTRLSAVRAGDEAALPSRDRGPVRRLVRDVVDSRRNLAEYFLPFAFLVLIASTLSRELAAYANLGFFVVLLGIVLDMTVLRRKVRAAVAQRHPDAPTKGLATYALMRSTQLRRLRLPPPKVKRGDPI